MVLGHEITGEIIERGSDVEYLNVGDLVSVPFKSPADDAGRVVRATPMSASMSMKSRPVAPTAMSISAVGSAARRSTS